MMYVKHATNSYKNLRKGLLPHTRSDLPDGGQEIATINNTSVAESFYQSHKNMERSKKRKMEDRLTFVP
jgi:hypothetical protein